MLTRPNARQLQVLHLLKNHAFWPEVEAVINAEIAAIAVRLTEARDEIDFRQMQGRAQALRDFRQLLAQSGSTLEKVERLPSGLGTN